MSASVDLNCDETFDEPDMDEILQKLWKVSSEVEREGSSKAGPLIKIVGQTMVQETRVLPGHGRVEPSQKYEVNGKIVNVLRHAYDMILEVDVNEINEDNYAVRNTIYQRKPVLERTDGPKLDMKDYGFGKKLFLRITKFPNEFCPGIMIPPVDFDETKGPWSEGLLNISSDVASITDVNRYATLYTHVNEIHVHAESEATKFAMQNFFSTVSKNSAEKSDMYTNQLTLLESKFKNQFS
ncbi:hypothetical protein CYMTET_31817 [Cymbomonas tetramitiformis]|uniref:Uncharacterized protein n=1 Tax=Cymbomonas tetramitiformis TaxID=36881 RepID=A0AAE0KSH8_9CHLO|nr:hypothetical protein CYMTET_31817 [Cymbomonas tetramitiformis]